MHAIRARIWIAFIILALCMGAARACSRGGIKSGYNSTPSSEQLDSEIAVRVDQFNDDCPRELAKHCTLVSVEGSSLKITYLVTVHDVKDAEIDDICDELEEKMRTATIADPVPHYLVAKGVTMKYVLSNSAGVPKATFILNAKNTHD